MRPTCSVLRLEIDRRALFPAYRACRPLAALVVSPHAACRDAARGARGSVMREDEGRLSLAGHAAAFGRADAFITLRGLLLV